MSSRITVNVEETCTPAQAGEIYNELKAAVPAHADVDIEVFVPHGIISSQPAGERS